MTQVQFYHLLSTPLERALPKVLEKAYNAGIRVHLVVGDEERVQYFNEWLWNYDPNSFLPHGTAKDGQPERQPLFISSGLEAANGAQALCVTEGSLPSAPEAFSRILDMFDGNNPAAVEAARGRWKAYKEGGHEVSYFRQTAQGGWEKAA